MKRVLLEIAILLTLAFLLDRAFALCFSRLVFSKTISGEAGGEINYMIQKKKEAGILILGSSRAREHLDPSRLSNLGTAGGYNAGANRVGGVLHGSVVLDIALHAGLHPKYVILQTDVGQFYLRGARPDRAALSLPALHPFFGKSPLLREYVREHMGFQERIKLLLHSYPYNGKILNILFHFRKRHSVPDNNGFAPLPGILDPAITAGPLRDDADSGAAPLDSLSLLALEKIVAACKTRNIRLIVVFLPFMEGCECGGIRRNLMQNLRDRGVDLLYDFGDVDAYPALKPRALWRDFGHLNPAGSAIFNGMLNDSLRFLNPANDGGGKARPYGP